MKIIDSELVFSSGRKAYAHCGLISIDEDGNLMEGYDGELDNSEQATGGDYRRLSDEERSEIIDFMIKRLEKYKK